jgi:hypothetical protein
MFIANTCTCSYRQYCEIVATIVTIVFSIRWILRRAGKGIPIASYFT